MKKILTICLISMFLPAGMQAQRAYIDGNKVIFDLSVEAGMPAEAVTSTRKYIGNFTPGTSASGAAYDEMGSMNATVYKKLEIAPRDISRDGDLSSSNAATQPWVDAFNYCKNLNYEGNGWRLPTQRELMLIYMFRPAFDKLIEILGVYTKSPFADAHYWSATEYRNVDGNAWFVDFTNGLTNSADKTYPTEKRMRCVREVE